MYLKPSLKLCILGKSCSLSGLWFTTARVIESAGLRLSLSDELDFSFSAWCLSSARRFVFIVTCYEWMNPTFPIACARRSHWATQQIEHQKRRDTGEHRTSQDGAFRPGTDLDPMPRPVWQDRLVRPRHPNMLATTHHFTQSRGQVWRNSNSVIR